MTRLENHDEEKFWEAWIKDETIFVFKYGKLGTTGHTKLKKFGSRAEAEAELEEKKAEKLDEGFEEIGGEDEDAEDAEDEGTDGDPETETATPKAKGRAKGAPKKAAKKAEAAQAEGPKDPLPPRFPSRTANPASLAAAKAALEATAASLGGRSYEVRGKARAARKALTALGGVDPEKYAILKEPFGKLLAAVVAPKKALPLKFALDLLSAVDAHAFPRVAKGWRAKALASPAADALSLLGAIADAVEDPEIALRLGLALGDARVSTDVAKARVLALKPYAEAALAPSKSNLNKILSGLSAGRDAALAARLLGARGV